MVHKIIMIRHGESLWNKENRFCGWYDADLSEEGVEQARAAGRALKCAGFHFDIAFTSLLKRARLTLQIVLNEIGQTDIVVHDTWRLNERHYGGLTGLNKDETAAKYGKAQVQSWCRNFHVSPPPLEESSEFYRIIKEDPRYTISGLRKGDFPTGESLETTYKRTVGFWRETIVPLLAKEGKSTILIVAHRNSLRCIAKHLNSMEDDEFMGVTFPNGTPFLFELDNDMKPTKCMQPIGNENLFVLP